MKEIEEHGDEMKAQLEHKEISTDEYSKFLMGSHHTEFNKSREIEANIKEWLT